MKLIIRKAQPTDIPFLVESVIQAEKLDTEIISYCTLFEISEEKLRDQIASAMINEEGITPWEIKHWYVAANQNNQPLAALCAWEEFNTIGTEIQKFQYLNFCNKPNLQDNEFLSRMAMLKQIAIPRVPHFIQLDALFTDSKFRGMGIMSELIQFVFNKYQQKTFQIQVLGCNQGAINLYKKLGFKEQSSAFCDGLKENRLLADQTKFNLIRNGNGV